MPLARIAALQPLANLRVIGMVNESNLAHGYNEFEGTADKESPTWLGDLVHFVPLKLHTYTPSINQPIASEYFTNELLGRTALEPDTLHDSTTMISTLGRGRYYSIFKESTHPSGLSCRDEFFKVVLK